MRFNAISDLDSVGPFNFEEIVLWKIINKFTAIWSKVLIKFRLTWTHHNCRRESFEFFCAYN